MTRGRVPASPFRLRRYRDAVVIVAALLAAWVPAAPAAEGDAHLLALNLYHEARQDGRDGMIAVGWVVLNRVADPGFPDSVQGVIEQGRERGRCQWGWLCDRRTDEPTDEEWWAVAQAVATELLSADPPGDPTGGAVWMMEHWRKPPAWLRQAAVRSVRVGGNAFYVRR